MKCSKCKNEVAGKHCTGCGTAAPTMTKSVCPAGHETDGEQAFCGDCGGAMTKAVAPSEYDTALADIDALLKSNTALAKDVDESDDDDDIDDEKKPTKAADADDEEEGEDEEEEDEPMAKSALPSEYEAVDAAPLVAALLESNKRLVKSVVGLRREIGSIHRENGVFAKANAALLRQVKSLGEEIEAIGNARTGRKAQMSVVVDPTMTKSAPVELDRISILTKCTMAAKAGQLTGKEVAMVEDCLNDGGFVRLATESPGLAQRVKAVIEQAH